MTPGPEEAVFVPFDSALNSAPGHYVPARFWGYINQPSLFPAGWVHDIGLLEGKWFSAAGTRDGAYEAVLGEGIARSLGGDVALVIPWFALGFALYSVAYAAAGALASRQQNADTAGQPVTYGLLAVYFAGYVALSSDPSGPLATLLTVFPASAPLVLPARSALVGGVRKSRR